LSLIERLWWAFFPPTATRVFLNFYESGTYEVVIGFSNGKEVVYACRTDSAEIIDTKYE
jgi:hypothetical protein